MPEHAHIPVLLAETVAALGPRRGEVLVDCTAGLGGHTASLASALGPEGTIVLADLDAGNLAFATDRIRSLMDASRVIAHHGSFTELPRVLRASGLMANMVLADLGFSSSQVDDEARGLSFMRDGPLDMRLDRSRGPTAAEIIASTNEAELARIIEEYGEERMARRVAAAIVRARQTSPLRTSQQLAEVVRSVVPRSFGPSGARGIDPATRTFQALRIATNDELGHLQGLLDEVQNPLGGPWLAPGARVAIISFHSLEDRPVKRVFAEMVGSGRAVGITPGAVTAGDAETARNARARSAKLRAIALAG
ncbi:MAG: 16S rRNA (cytosine(1402)-N(4))-methyltransferase RsmH [Phycisphaerales bacterium]